MPCTVLLVVLNDASENTSNILHQPIYRLSSKYYYTTHPSLYLYTYHVQYYWLYSMMHPKTHPIYYINPSIGSAQSTTILHIHHSTCTHTMYSTTGCTQ